MLSNLIDFAHPVDRAVAAPRVHFENGLFNIEGGYPEDSNHGVAALIDEKSLDADRLHQEAVLLASKQDIREEIDRLKAHCEAARQRLAGSGAVGRRLDFLAQEFNREANTICSKAFDNRLTAVGLELKATIEQFREQVQNLE